MSLTPKPFVTTEKIRNRIFYPAPNVITGVDINQEKEAILTAMDRLVDRFGAFTSGLSIIINATLTKINPSSWSLAYSADFDAQLVGIKPKIYAKTVVFDLPATLVSFSGTYAHTAPPVIEWWLVAKKSTIDFATNPVMAGVNGPGFPSAQASSDAVVWSDETIAEIRNNTFTSLPAGYEYICKLGSIIYRDDTRLGIASDYTAIAIPEAISLDNNNILSDLLSITNGITPLGAQPRNVVETIQRAGLLLCDIYNRLPSLSKYPDVKDVSVTTTLTAGDIRKLVRATGHSAPITIVLPNSTGLLDADSIAFYNNGNYPVTLQGTTATLMGNSTMILVGAGETVELVLDKTTVDWKRSFYFNFKSTRAYKEVSVATTLTVSDSEKLIYTEGSASDVTHTLPSVVNLEDGASFSFYNNSNYEVTIQTSGMSAIMTLPNITLWQSGNYIKLVLDKANSNWVIEHINNPPVVVPIPKPVYVYKNGGSIGTGTDLTFPFPSVVYDDDSLWNTTLHKYTVPKDGYYSVRTQGFVSAPTSTPVLNFILYKNGAGASRMVFQNNNAGNVTFDGTNTYEFTGQTVIKCVAGDELSFHLLSDTSLAFSVSQIPLFIEYVNQ